MNSKNMFAHKEIDVFYTRWFIRTLLFVVFIFMPLMIEHWIDVTTTDRYLRKKQQRGLATHFFCLRCCGVSLLKISNASE